MAPGQLTTKRPNKRLSAGSVTTQTLLDFDLSESSDDSDFRIEDHDDESDCSLNSNDDDQSEKDDDDDDSDDEDSDDSNDSAANRFGGLEQKRNGMASMNMLLEQGIAKDAFERTHAKLLAKPICCACLGDRSDDTNEIVECDNCGISVHEGCYGISDSTSVSSTISSCSTEPWFCEACKANISDPSCELCPNKGGIFKETDVGKWVHLVCALYVPGVAFGEVDHLSSVTLFEMPYSKWGAKTCSLCEDARFARCGVCIGCDAGMCKTYFHVTCAQAVGLLQPFEAHSEEADHADPFYAHCKIHSDKTLIKHRKRNYDALRLKMSYRNANIEQLKLQNTSPEQKRIERKLKKHRNKYISNKSIKNEPWVPTQKMPRLLTTSASACRRLLAKAELMGIDVAALEFQEAQIASLNDVRKKWHIPPAFSVEFIGYYLDRISRSTEVKKNLQEQIDLNKTLVSEQQSLREKYDACIAIREEQTIKKNELIEKIEKLHSAILALCPSKTLTPIDVISAKHVETVAATAAAAAAPPPPLTTILAASRPMSVPTAAALKMGVGFPLTIPGTNDDTNRVLSTQCPNKSELLYECGICKRVNDQHLLAKCDTCHLHYHLGCLNPPLTRHPKKSKIYGWQCSECDEDNPDGVVQLTSGPRKSRTKYSKDGTIVPVDSSRDVSMDESGADDDKINNVQSDKKATPKSPIPVKIQPKSPVLSKSPTPKSPVLSKSPTTKKPNKKCDKTDKIDKTPTKKTKTNVNDGIISPVLSTSSAGGETNKSDIAKSPPKLRKSLVTASSTNLDKVIEAVSKGILEDNHDSIIGQKRNHIEVSPIKSPKVNGVQNKLNDSKSDVEQERAISPSKAKPNKKAKKDKEKSKDKEKETVAMVTTVTASPTVAKEKEVNKEKDKNKNKDKDMEDKEKVKAKNNVKEKSKRKAKVASPDVLNTSPKTVVKVKVEKYKSEEKNVIETEHDDVSKTEMKIPENHSNDMPMNISADSTNTSELNTSKNATSVNGEVCKAQHMFNDGINGVATSTTTTMGTDNERKQSRKRRKEKHRNKHGQDAERSSSKEHKKKRKRKNHDHEKIESFPLADGVPKIKIKFKALPLPGETTAESHFFYVPANMVRPREFRRTRPASVNSIDDVASTPFAFKSPAKMEPSMINSPQKDTDKVRVAVSSPPVRTRRTSSLLSPPKANSRRTSTPVSVNSNDTANDLQICFVCQVSGTAHDLVKCDECKKSYHFRCLEPPLKKTPKRRGYSWHCADCDPTDKEDN